MATTLGLALPERLDFLSRMASRGRTGIGRNLTLPVLEFPAREGLTRFDVKRHRPLP